MSETSQSVRSIFSRLAQQAPIRLIPFSVISEQDSNKRVSSLLQEFAIETRELSVSSRQQVRSIEFRSTQLDTSSETPSSVMPLHLPSPIFVKCLQLAPMICRLVTETWDPSSFNVRKPFVKPPNLDKKSGVRSYIVKFHYFTNRGKKNDTTLKVRTQTWSQLTRKQSPALSFWRDLCPSITETKPDEVILWERKTSISWSS